MIRKAAPIVLPSLFTGVLAVAAGLLAACGASAPRDAGLRDSEDSPTFSKDIAPILFQNCAPCHHPGGSGPFSVLTYEEVKRRGKQIAKVTLSRYMPPWLPEPGYGEFEGERRLSERQIGTIGRWVEQGAIEGNPADLPSVPEFHEGWQLGTPDLVVSVPEPFVLQAEGIDVFRNFVIPVPVTRARYVSAMEILPGNKKIVHHANVLVDRARSSRRLDALDPDVGFGGMDVQIESERFEPESHFLFWKPGTAPYRESDDMNWGVDRDTDLVLNMHLQPSGKPERIQPSVGLYFSEKPPARFPMLLQLEHDGSIDIPPGKKDFVVTDEFRLPLDVDVLGVYPHAHYLGKDIQGFATLPGGSKKWLLRIKDWDFNWQAVYRYREPVFLPKGTTISMRFTYDNSADNVRNPNHPPRRVVAGDRSTDEMGHLWFQLLPREGRDGRLVLQEEVMRHRLRKYPKEFSAHFNLGAVLQSRGEYGQAIAHFRQALALKPRDATALNNLGTALQALGRVEEAVTQYREALRARPDYIHAHYNLGTAFLAKGRPSDAIPHFLEVLQSNPDDADANNDLGSAFGSLGRLAQAAAHFERAIRQNPDHPFAHINLAYVLARQGKLSQAVSHFEEALRINPSDEDARKSLKLARAQLARGR